MSNPTALVQKLWNYCNILRDDGLSYGDYVEQLTFLLFLKMADEQSHPPFNKPSPIPKGKDWPALLAKDGDELESRERDGLPQAARRGSAAALIKFIAAIRWRNCGGIPGGWAACRSRRQAGRKTV
jgi:type I restriction enzyme M protein